VKYCSASSLGLRPNEVGQKGLELFYLRHHSKKNPKPKPKKFFFHCRLKDLWVFWAFEQLFSAYSAEDIPAQRPVQTAGFRL